MAPKATAGEESAWFLQDTELGCGNATVLDRRGVVVCGSRTCGLLPAVARYADERVLPAVARYADERGLPAVARYADKRGAEVVFHT